MTPLENAPNIFLFAKKIFSFKNGALIVMAAPGSLTITGIFEALIADTPIKDIVLPLLVGGLCLVLYFIIFLIDFKSGTEASKMEAARDADHPKDKSYFESGKAWSSIFKIAVVFLLVIWSSIFSAIFAIAHVPALPTFFMLASGTVAIMATLFDCYSIGENQKRITGKKARFFIWLEEKGDLINEGFTKKIKNLF